MKRPLILILLLSLLSGIGMDAFAEDAEMLFSDFDISKLPQVTQESYEYLCKDERAHYLKCEYLAGKFFVCQGYVIYANAKPMHLDDDWYWEDISEEYGADYDRWQIAYNWLELLFGQAGDTEELISRAPRVEDMDFSKPLPKERQKKLVYPVSFSEESLRWRLETDDVNRYLWLTSYQGETIRWGDWLIKLNVPPPTFEKEKDPWYIRQGEWAYEYYKNNPEYMKQVQEERYREDRREFGYGDLWERFFEEHPEALYLSAD